MAEKALGSFDGFPIDSTGVEIPKLSGGLHDAVRVSDVEFHRGDAHYLVLKVEPDKFKLNPTFALDGSGRPTSEQKGWQQVAVMSLRGVAFLAEEAAQEALEATAKLIEEQRIRDEEAAGVARIPFAGGESGENPDGSIAGAVDGAVKKKRAAKKPASSAKVKDIATRGKGSDAGE